MDATATEAPISQPGEDVASRPRLARWKRTLAWTAVGVFGMWGGYRVSSFWLVEREDDRTSRDPVTGVMLGAEPRELGPQNAPNVALFVHGFAGCGNNFNRVPDLLAQKGWRVKVMLLPGHGTSPKDMEITTADDLIEAVETEAAALRETHERVILIGHSMGGTLSTITASRVPIDGIVLGGAYFGVTYRWYYGLRPEQWTALGSHLVRWVYKGDLFLQVNNRAVKDDIICYTWLPTKAGVTLNELGRRVNNPAVLDNVTCPVLMLHSHGDVAASPQAAERAFSQMAATDKLLVWLPRSNHHIYWDFDHEQVETEILKFADTVAARPVLTSS